MYLQIKVKIFDSFATHSLLSLVPHNNDPSGPEIRNAYLNENMNNNLQVASFDGGDYQRGPEAYLNPPKPKFRGDHGLEDYDSSGSKPLYVPKQILVHLDLKGAAPKIDYLLKFIKVLHNLV